MYHARREPGHRFLPPENWPCELAFDPIMKNGIRIGLVALMVAGPVGCSGGKSGFEPKTSADWGAIPVYSPVSGTLDSTRADSFGLQIVIRSTASPAFTFIIFHVNPSISVTPETPLASGQRLGTHIGRQTMSDIAVGVSTPAGYRLVSWFEAMSEGVCQGYAARGVASRQAATISLAARDADPLSCNGETFTSSGTIESWLTLR